jgi:hypothetical protein
VGEVVSTDFSNVRAEAGRQSAFPLAARFAFTVPLGAGRHADDAVHGDPASRELRGQLDTQPMERARTIRLTAERVAIGGRRPMAVAARATAICNDRGARLEGLSMYARQVIVHSVQTDWTQEK